MLMESMLCHHAIQLTIAMLTGWTYEAKKGP